MYWRPSRYAEADKFFGFAATEFGDYVDSATLLEKVSSWVATRLNYMPGSSGPIDGAVDTLLASAGVCRDFAHLVVAMLRAVNVPAQLVRCTSRACIRWTFMRSPRRSSRGISGWSTEPCWHRQTLVRIATGRDAAGRRFPGQPQR